jgi:hypothetical protein
LPQRVITIGQQRDRLVHLEVLRVQHLVQTALRLGIQRLDKSKPLERGRLAFFILCITQDTLATMTSNLCFLSNQLRT